MQNCLLSSMSSSIMYMGCLLGAKTVVPVNHVAQKRVYMHSEKGTEDNGHIAVAGAHIFTGSCSIFGRSRGRPAREAVITQLLIFWGTAALCIFMRSFVCHPRLPSIPHHPCTQLFVWHVSFYSIKINMPRHDRETRDIAAHMIYCIIL